MNPWSFPRVSLGCSYRFFFTAGSQCLMLPCHGRFPSNPGKMGSRNGAKKTSPGQSKPLSITDPIPRHDFYIFYWSYCIVFDKSLTKKPCFNDDSSPQFVSGLVYPSSNWTSPTLPSEWTGVSLLTHLLTPGEPQNISNLGYPAIKHPNN